jgi:hypothetical protein
MHTILRRKAGTPFNAHSVRRVLDIHVCRRNTYFVCVNLNGVVNPDTDLGTGSDLD